MKHVLLYKSIIRLIPVTTKNLGGKWWLSASWIRATIVEGRRQKKCRLFCMPSNLVLREMWITPVSESVCGLRKGMRCIGDSAAICSDHFTEASYSIRNGKKILNENNVPTEFHLKKV
jgi:hypothetical protein